MPARPRVVRASLPAFAVALACWMEVLASRSLGRPPLVALLGAVLLSAWFGGVRSGLTALVCALLAAFVMNALGLHLALDSQPTDVLILVVAFIATVAGAVALGVRGPAAAERRRRAQPPSPASATASQAMADALPVLLSHVDRRGRYTFVNAGYERWFGTPKHTLVGTHVRDLIGDAAYKLIEGAIERVLRGETVRYDGTLPYLRGGQRDIEITYVPSRTAGGEVSGFYALITDQSQRRSAERALVDRDERLHLIASVANDAIWDWDLATGRIDWNEAAQQLFSCPPSETYGADSTWPALIHDDDRERVVASIRAAIERGDELWSEEYRLRRPNGEYAEVLDRGAVQRHDGRAVRMIGAMIDQTERRAAARAVAESQRALAALITNLPGIAYRRDADARARPRYVSELLLQYTGREPADLTHADASWFDIVHPFDVERVRAELDSALREERPFSITYRVRDAHGKVRWLLDRGRRVPGLDGAPPAVEGFASDVGERVHAEQEVARLALDREALLESERAARKLAELHNRLKDEFVANLSHELRTPINAVLGWVQLIRQSTLDADELAQGLDVIERNARLQAQLIGDLLDMSSMISGKTRLSQQDVDMAEVVDAAIATLLPTAETRGVTIVSDASATDVHVSGDPARLQQIVWNLLSNAVKFTQRGGRVEVRLARSAQQAQLVVADNGRGVDEQFLPHLFERFRQADAGASRESGGLGLGLAIVKQLVELHGGHVRASSAGIGHGTMFTVTLPLATSHDVNDVVTPTPPQPIAPPRTNRPLPRVLDGLTILVVEDEPDARELLQRVLSAAGASVRGAGSVAEALELVEAAPPELLISDIGMPLRDGYDLIRAIRARPSEAGGTMLAIAVTAFARDEDRRRALQAGFHAHVTKPIDARLLIATIDNLRVTTKTAERPAFVPPSVGRTSEEAQTA